MDFKYCIFCRARGSGIEYDASVNRYGYRLISVDAIMASWMNISLLEGGMTK